MAQVTSGKVLRETRERKGYDLTTVARRLRIRPDILRAIESSDFSAMPPRGYTRNMVNAYARLLGLNPTEIVNMFLDEAYAHQVQRARTGAPGSGFDMGRDRRVRNRVSRSDHERAENLADDYRMAAEPYESRRGKRRLYDDRTQYSRDDYGVTRERIERDDRSSRDFMSHHSGYPPAARSGRESRSSQRGGRQVHVGQTPMEMSAPRLPVWLTSRWPLIAAAVAVLLIIFLLVTFVFGNHDPQPSEDVSQLPVSGISDTTGTQDSAEEEELNVEVAPTSARIVYSVPGEGDQVYVEIYDDSETPQPQMLTGPVEQTAETTGVWTITTFTPDSLKLTVNGEEVKMQASEDYGGMYAYTVDFPKYLEEWRQTHSSKSSQRQAAVASAANAANAKSSSAASPSATSASSGAASPTGGAAEDATAQGSATSGV